MTDAKTRGAVVIVVTYAVTIVLTVGCAAVMRRFVPVWAAIGLADLLGTALVFAVSRRFNNSSVYDPYWSIAPPVIAVGLAATEGGVSARTWVVCGLVTLWGVRLTYNWWRGWRGLGHEDWRYVDLRRSTGRAYWWVSLAGLHLFPTLLVFVGCLPLFSIASAEARPVGWIDGLAVLVTVAAIATEAIADRQLHDFVASGPDSQDVLTRGLWGRCRHPNYLGEVAFWYGLGVFGLAADGTAWWLSIGPLVMTLLFVFISIPMIERRMLSKRPRYADVVAHYPRLLPLGRRRSGSF